MRIHDLIDPEDMPFRVERWAGDKIDTLIAVSNNQLVAKAAYQECLKLLPKATLRLRVGVRVIEERIIEDVVSKGAERPSEALPDESLRFGLHDAMRGVKVPSLKRALTDDERKILSDAIFAAMKRNKWKVMCTPSPNSTPPYRGDGG